MRYILSITMKAVGKNKSVAQTSQRVYDSEEELTEAKRLFDEAMKIGRTNPSYSSMYMEARIIIE